jgi:hypothetical protein
MSLTIRGGVSPVPGETDTDGNFLVNPPMDEEKAGFVLTGSEVDPGNAGASIARTVRPDDTSADFRKRVGLDTPQFYKAFTGAFIQSNVWHQNLFTMSISQSGGSLRINSGNSVASGNFANIYTYAFFSQQMTMPLYCEMDVKYVSSGLQSGVTAEFGLINGPTGVSEPSDGAFFRYQNSSLLAVLSYGGSSGEVVSVVDPSIVPVVNDNSHYLIAFYTDYVEFWINGELVARITQPTANGAPTLSPSQQLAFRMRNTAAVASPVQLHISTCGVDLGDAFSGQTWGEYAVMNGGGSWQTQDGTNQGQTALWSNNAAPAAGTLANATLPAAGYNTLGGRYDFNAPVGSETDYIAFAFQVPAGTNALPGKNLWVKSISISLYNAGAVVAVTPTQVEWGIGLGSTALSLATVDTATARSPKRIYLCNLTLQLGAIIGEGAKEGTFMTSFPDGLMVESGTFFHVIIRVPVGTATASQRLRGGVSVVGEFRLWERGRFFSATSATRTGLETRTPGTLAFSPPTAEGSLRSSAAASSARPIAS